MQKEFEIQCGDIDGTFKADTPGEAYRQLLARAQSPICLGVVARFRRVDLWRNRSEAKWRYQNPAALEKSA